MERLKKDFSRVLPDGVKGEIIYGDGTKLPFDDESVDFVFMANVLSGHIKKDKRMRAGLPVSKKVMSEKLGILSEAKRVLKMGGRVVIEEEYAESYKKIREKIIKILRKDNNWELKEHDSEDQLIIELIKKNEEQD